MAKAIEGRAERRQRSRRAVQIKAVQSKTSRAPDPARSAESFTVYASRLCPYSQRVRLVAALANRPDAISTVEVPVTGSEQSVSSQWFTMLAKSADLLPRVPLCRVSFEGFQARLFSESLVINELLAGSLNLPLTFADSAVQRAKMHLQIRHCDDSLIPSGWRFLSSIPGTDEERISFEHFYDALEYLDSQLGTSGGAFLGGDALTLADIAYLPFIDRFSVACNHFKGYDFLRGENHWRFIRRWMHHMCEMDEFTSTRLNDEEIIQLVDQQLNENYFERFGLTRKAPPARPERRGFRLQPSDSYAAIMDTLKGATEEACESVRRLLGSNAVKTKENERDVVTQADQEVQQIIQSYVKARHPDHAFLGEESVPPGTKNAADAISDLLSSGSEFAWINDPVDGTMNSTRSLPLLSISTGVAFRGEMVCGIVADPLRNEFFTAIKGKGAFLNDVPINVSSNDTLESSIVGTGYGTSPGSAGPVSRAVGALTRAPVQSVRMLGSAALMFAYTSAGRLDAYAEASLNSWDSSAGSLLVKEAGGEVTSLKDGSDYDLTTRAVIASNGHVHKRLQETLQSAGVTGLDE